MNWSDQRTRIRRFLRDPDGNVWSDSLLLRLYNNEQQDVFERTGMLAAVCAIRVPPRYGMAYMFDWEWAHRDTTGRAYQCLRLHHQSDVVCCFMWEAEQLSGRAATVTDYGWAFTNPWEAWYASTPGQLVPVWFPDNFHVARMVAWDKEPIEFVPLKRIQSDDPTWVTRSGVPMAYTRRDATSNEFYLYPRPSAPVWDDDDGTGNAVLYADDDTVSGDEDVAVQTRTGSLFFGNSGIATDVVSADDNVLLVYDARPTDIADDTVESDYPVFLRKYIEYGVIAEAYRANTDGRIESLGDYWAWRKSLGLEALRRLKLKRRTDRNFRLVTQQAPGRRTRREPRLPDGYPAIVNC